MLKIKKANSKVAKKSDKIIKKPSEENPKEKKQQLAKIKKSVNVGLVEKLDGVDKLKVKKGNKEPKTKMIVLEDPPESEVESGEESVEKSEVESGGESVEQSQVESGEESEVESGEESVNQSQVKSRKKSVKKSEVGNEEDAETEDCAEGIGYTVVVSNIPAETSRAQLHTIFAPYGKIISILFITDRGIVFSKIVPKTSSSAFIVLDSVEAAEKALNLKGTHLNSQQLCVEKPQEKQILGQKKFTRSNSKNTVFVSNLSSNNLDSIKNLFSRYGEIAYINIIKTPFKGKYKAFVCFKDDGVAKLALKSNGSMLDEERIRVVVYSEEKRSAKSEQEFKNFDKEEFKNQMLQLVQKFINPIQGKKTQSKKNSEFRGVKSGGIKKVEKLIEGVMKKF